MFCRIWIVTYLINSKNSTPTLLRLAGEGAHYKFHSDQKEEQVVGI